MNWPKYPLIYEINTWVWLNELSHKHRRSTTLANIPAAEWDALAEMGMDAVWLMERYLVAVNLSDTSSQGLVKVPWEDMQGRTCRLDDALSDETYRDGNQMRAPGLFVDLKPWAAHCFQVQPVS